MTSPARNAWFCISAVSAAGVAGVAAFAHASQAHALDLLLATAVCGRPMQGMLWGHCAACYSAAAFAAGGVLVAFSVAAALVGIDAPKHALVRAQP